MPKIIFCGKCSKRMRAELRIPSADPEHRYYFSCACVSYRVVSENDYGLYARVEQWKGRSLKIRNPNRSHAR
jgi:hypothetical protein